VVADPRLEPIVAAAFSLRPVRMGMAQPVSRPSGKNSSSYCEL